MTRRTQHDVNITMGAIESVAFAVVLMIWAPLLAGVAAIIIVIRRCVDVMPRRNKRITAITTISVVALMVAFMTWAPLFAGVLAVIIVIGYCVEIIWLD